MNIKESLIYAIMFILANVIVFVLFAYAYLENVSNETKLLHDKRAGVEILKEKYQVLEFTPKTPKCGCYFNVMGIHFLKQGELHKKLSDNTYISIRYIDVIKTVSTNKYFLLTNMVLTLNAMFLYYNIIYKRRIEETQKKFIENRLKFQTTMILTENLHHEINTPLAVISHKIKKMALIQSKIKGIDKLELESDYKATNASIIMIRDILERLKSVKHLKVYESNRTFYEVIKSSCEMMKVSNAEHFEYQIDEAFKEYKLDGNYMKNGELSGILLNLVKNSVEAHANDVSFRFGGIEEDLCIIYIGDNGNGISDSIKNQIFNENFTSKEGIRGNGLYINKFLVTNSKGSIKLIETSSNGTAFELKLLSVVATHDDMKRAEENDYDVVKKLECDIANKDTLIQQFLDSLPDMAWLKGIDGRYIIANKAIKEGLLFDAEPIGKTDVEMAKKAKQRFGDENHTFGEKCANSDVITIQRNEPSRFLESGKIKGEMMYLEVHKNVIRDLNGNIIGVCGTGRDLSEYIEAVAIFEQSCGGCNNNLHLGAFTKYRFEG